MQNQETQNYERLQLLLKQKFQHSSEVRFIHRLHCVLLVRMGHNCYELARCFGENPRTLERWLQQYQESGVAGLTDGLRSGRPKKLRADQLVRLQRDVCVAPSEFAYGKKAWSGSLLATHLQSRYGVMLSVRQCQRLLRQLR